MTVHSGSTKQAGFGAIAAIVVLVILAALAAAMTRFGSIQHMTSAQDVLAVRAQAAARSGIEYGLYRALKESDCSTKDLNLFDDTGFHVTVECQSRSFNEGESINETGTATEPRTLKVYTLTATACNMPAGTSCPNNHAVTSPGYVERVLQTVATNVDPD